MLTGSTVYRRGNPIVSMTATDTKLSVLQTDFPNLAVDAYQGLYQLRLKTSGPGQTAGSEVLLSRHPDHRHDMDRGVLGGCTTAATPAPAAAGHGVHPAVPARLLETRPGRSTIDGLFNDIGAVLPTARTQFTVANRGGVARGRIWRRRSTSRSPNPPLTGSSRCIRAAARNPMRRTSTTSPVQTIPNAVIAKIGTDGKVCLFNSQPTHLVVDVNGVVPRRLAVRGAGSRLD